MSDMDPLTAVGWTPKIFTTIRDFLGRPRAAFEFEYGLNRVNENAYCHYRLHVQSRVPGWFIRLGVRNRGGIAILNSDVRVEGIDLLDQEGNVQSFSSTPFFLHWANENTDNSRHLYPDTPVYVDLVFTAQGREEGFVFSKDKHAQAGITTRLPIGTYIFHLKLLGQNIQPVNQKVKVQVNGRWDDIRVELLK